MPQGILKFELPEEREEFETAQKAGSWASFAFEIDQWLRSKIKYQENQQTTYQDIRDELHRLLDEHDLNI